MLDEFLGGVREERNVSIGLRGGETTRLLGCCRRGLILFREVNELNRTLEASTL